ncbi:MAG: hypothetical protein FJY88_02060 [Candidatus Eisenbacteria bacterium]|nr:hypothetical protein [Candidatus Eisenbacteria bacterium]
MRSDEFRDLLSELAEAWRDKRYVDAVKLFTPDVRYIDPIRYSLSGSEALLAFFQSDEGYPQVTTWHHILFDEAAQIGAAEYSFRGTHLYHGVVLVTLERDRIACWREYQHVSDRDWGLFFRGA